MSAYDGTLVSYCTANSHSLGVITRLTSACLLPVQAAVRRPYQLPQQPHRSLHTQLRSARPWWSASRSTCMHLGLATLTVASGTGLAVRCMAATGQTITEKVALRTCLPSHLHCLLPLGSIVAFHSRHMPVHCSSYTCFEILLRLVDAAALSPDICICNDFTSAGHWCDVS